MAPELYEEVYNEKVDIYAFGMCLIEMITGLSPYHECTSAPQIYKKVLQGDLPPELELVSKSSVRAKDFIQSCLIKSDIRPSATEALNRDFLLVSNETEDFEEVRIKLTKIVEVNEIISDDDDDDYMASPNISTKVISNNSPLINSIANPSVAVINDSNTSNVSSSSIGDTNVTPLDVTTEEISAEEKIIISPSSLVESVTSSSSINTTPRTTITIPETNPIVSIVDSIITSSCSDRGSYTNSIFESTTNVAEQVIDTNVPRFTNNIIDVTNTNTIIPSPNISIVTNPIESSSNNNILIPSNVSVLPTPITALVPPILQTSPSSELESPSSAAIVTSLEVSPQIYPNTTQIPSILPVSPSNSEGTPPLKFSSPPSITVANPSTTFESQQGTINVLLLPELGQASPPTRQVVIDTTTEIITPLALTMPETINVADLSDANHTAAPSIQLPNVKIFTIPHDVHVSNSNETLSPIQETINIIESHVVTSQFKDFHYNSIQVSPINQSISSIPIDIINQIDIDVNNNNLVLTNSISNAGVLPSEKVVNLINDQSLLQLNDDLVSFTDTKTSITTAINDVFDTDFIINNSKLNQDLINDKLLLVESQSNNNDAVQEHNDINLPSISPSIPHISPSTSPILNSYKSVRRRTISSSSIDRIILNSKNSNIDVELNLNSDVNNSNVSVDLLGIESDNSNKDSSNDNKVDLLSQIENNVHNINNNNINNINGIVKVMDIYNHENKNSLNFILLVPVLDQSSEELLELEFEFDLVNDDSRLIWEEYCDETPVEIEKIILVFDPLVIHAKSILFKSLQDQSNLNENFSLSQAVIDSLFDLDINYNNPSLNLLRDKRYQRLPKQLDHNTTNTTTTTSTNIVPIDNSISVITRSLSPSEVLSNSPAVYPPIPSPVSVDLSTVPSVLVSVPPVKEQASNATNPPSPIPANANTNSNINTIAEAVSQESQQLLTEISITSGVVNSEKIVNDLINIDNHSTNDNNTSNQIDIINLIDIDIVKGESNYIDESDPDYQMILTEYQQAVSKVDKEYSPRFQSIQLAKEKLDVSIIYFFIFYLINFLF
jgi:hypothetical protein